MQVTRGYSHVRWYLDHGCVGACSSILTDKGNGVVDPRPAARHERVRPVINFEDGWITDFMREP